MNKKSRKTAIIIVVVLVLAITLYFVLGPKNKAGGVSIDTDTVSLIDITNTVTSTGTVEPLTEVEVGTQVSGIVDKLYVDYNDQVKAGQVIAEMDRITLQAEMQQAQSELESNQTEFNYREKEFKRISQLYEKELVSEKEFDEAQYYYEKARNAYQKSQYSMVKVKRNLSYATITSPIDGVVISRAVEEGQTVAAGFETPTLFTIARDLTQMKIIADVDEADIGQVLEGQKVEFTVDAYPDDTFYGTVNQVRLEPTTESNVVTYDVVIIAENPELKLKPGLTANITFITQELKGVTSVPTKSFRVKPDRQAIEQLGYTLQADMAQPGDGMMPAMPKNAKQVWVIEGNTIRPAMVSTGSTSGDRTQIDGLPQGTTVITAINTVSEDKSSADMPERSPFMPTPPGSNKQKQQDGKPQ